MPIVSSFSRSISWLTISNGLSKSKNTPAVCPDNCIFNAKLQNSRTREVNNISPVLDFVKEVVQTLKSITPK